MSFVNPLFIFGALAAGIPILIHLIKRERAKRIEFPTLMFLRRISRKTIRYQKLRHLLLLMLRVLAVLLLALAFLRPYRDIPGAAASPGHVPAAHILLLDNSLSMGYGDRWERARSAAADIARRLPPGDKLSLIEFSDQAVVRVPLTGEPASVIADLTRGVRLSDRPTRYAPALRAAEKTALDAATGRRIVHMISDFQKSGWGSEEQEFRLGPGIELVRIDVGEDEFSNLTIGNVRVSEGAGDAEDALQFRFSLINFGSRERNNVRLRAVLDGRSVLEKMADTGKGEVRSVEFRLPRLPAGAHQVVLEVEDTLLARDNRHSMMVESRGRTQVLAVEDQEMAPAGHPPSYFLSRALNVQALSRYQLISVPLRRIESGSIPMGSPVIWNNAPAGSAAVQKKLQDFVEGGGGLVVVAADAGRASDFNRGFGSWLPVKIAEPQSGERGAGRRMDEYALLTDLRMDHPIFHPFSEPHSGSFATARFYRHARLELSGGAEALARFDNGDAALVSAGRGKGRVVIFASSADDSANDLPLKAVYAPFWQQLMRYLDNAAGQSYSVEVGSTVSPRKILQEAALRSGKGGLDNNQTIVLLDPARQRLPGAQAGDAVLVDQAGFYEVRSAGQSANFAVNPVVRESDLTHGNSEEMVAGWVSAGAKAPAVVAGDERLAPEELDQRQRMWRYLLLAALVLFIGESLLANQFVLKPD